MQGNGDVAQLGQILTPLVVLFLNALAVLVAGHFSSRRKKTLSIRMRAALGLGFLGTMAWAVWFAKQPAGVPFSDYRVQVRIEDASDVLGDVSVTTSVWGETSRVGDHWEADIPVSRRPTDGRIQIFVKAPDDFLEGNGSLVLGDEPRPMVLIRLKKKVVRLRGFVLDDEDRPIPGVLVYAGGHRSDGVNTDATGLFELSAHAAEGEPFRLKAERAGYGPVDRSELALGSSEFVIRMSRSRP